MTRTNSPLRHNRAATQPQRPYETAITIAIDGGRQLVWSTAAKDHAGSVRPWVAWRARFR